MDRVALRVQLDDNVRPTFENRAHFVQPPRENVWPVRLLTAQADVPADRVPLSTLSELAVVGEQHGAMLVRVDGLVVIRGVGTAGLRRRPGSMPCGLDRPSTTRVDVVIEVEAHLRFDRAPGRIEIVGG